MGPTASGKSAIAEELANRTDAQLISADAYQIYRGFDIGTAKPDHRDRYEMIDIRDPINSFGAGEFALIVCQILNKLFESSRNAIIVGGTGMYVRALFEEYKDMAPAPDPKLRARLYDDLAQEGLEATLARLDQLSPNGIAETDRANPRRVIRALEKALSPSTKLSVVLPPFRKRKFGIVPQIEGHNRSIHERLRAMMQGGFIEEVEKLISDGTPVTAPAMNAIGYRTLTRMLAGDLSGGTAFESIEIETRQYAKRQRTWLRSEPNLIIIEPDSVEGTVDEIHGHLK